MLTLKIRESLRLRGKMAYNVVEEKSMNLQFKWGLVLKIPPLIIVGSLKLWVNVRLLKRVRLHFDVCFGKQKV